MSHKAENPIDRENQLINAAVNLAEKQIADGTASPSVLVHFLKLATAEAKLKTAKLEAEAKLNNSKVKQIDKQNDAEVNEATVIEALKTYRGG